MELPMFYDQGEEWNRALLLYDAALKEVNTKLEILNNEFKLAHQYNPIEHITSRIKTPQSIAKKIRHNNMELTVENIVKYINDVAGIRIICSFTSDIYRIADLIRKQSDVKVLKIKDYITNPKPNGYMSYHMIITVPIFLSQEVVETKVEIQIRTIAMDFWASLEHKMYYKFEGNAPSHITRELKECADIVSFLDQKMLAINEEIRTYSGDTMDHYRDIVSGMFHSKIKDSYGSIVEDNINEEKVAEKNAPEKVKAIEQKEVIIDNEINAYSEMVSALQEKALKQKPSDKVPFSLFGSNKRKKQEMKANAQ